ncbi:hypothetical protein ES288_D09G285500v1 [Gossypium darwinii]|uniref:Radical S-adenosyl methionine domain-containing protein 1, mitochondrial n=1 Tax=Gossypium darwinii TaxID=34276 RepID=A0A5D2BHJ7_GOSDA|nr:hypothetical protein ES288_D09G285500v1 [Gossypium darwinii]
MLKSILTPIFSTFPAEPRYRKLLCRAISCNFNPIQTVRQNAAPNIFTTPQLPPTSVYIHLPFCRKRCHYCDFPVVALGSNSPAQTNDNEDDPQINASRVSFESHSPLETVFFGGGTPSLVPPRLVSSILDLLKGKFGVTSDAEISTEMDPGTFDVKKMEEFMELGVNRVSLGVQAFQEQLLKACGRAHGVDEVNEAIEIMKSCGVENWSLDLISSLPNQAPQMWEESLKLTIEAQPNYVSVYDLQVEQGTKFGTLYTPGEFPLPTDVQSADFYRMASSMLSAAGYNHYEISSYCQDGFECKHNFTYWKNKPFYGFGLGSASYVRGMRFSRPKKMGGYINFVRSLENGMIVMLSLRTAAGLNLKSFRCAFGYSVVASLCEAYKPFIESGHVLCLNEQRRVVTADEFNASLNEDGIGRGLAYIRLSDPDGFLLSNELISIAFGVIAL